MAGIGFELRRLYRQNTLSGLVGVSLHSTFAATGPWLATVLAVGFLSLFGGPLTPAGALFSFRAILIYNFSFSLVLAGPVFMVATRFLADAIHRRDVQDAPGLLVGALHLLCGVAFVVGAAFYFLYADLPATVAASALANFMLVNVVWLLGIFLSALKDYRRITWAFVLGMLAAVVCGLLLARPFGTAGLLNGFSIGLGLTVGLLIARIRIEYPYPVRNTRAFLGYFRRYWEIALGGLVYGMGVWVDKWIMWWAPEATRLPSGLLVYPHYDSAMFLAHLTTVPAMALFLFHAETHFFERYVHFYRDIESKAPYERIRTNHQQLSDSISGNAWVFVALQGSIALLGVLLAPQIIELLQGRHLQIGILRYGLLGGMFHVFLLFSLILLSYFDNRRGALWAQSFFLLTNAGLTWLSLRLGFQYYGYGYFLASFASLLLAAGLTATYLARLPYHTFITTNASIQK